MSQTVPTPPLGPLYPEGAFVTLPNGLSYRRVNGSWTLVPTPTKEAPPSDA